jgi:VanZ family protein
MQKASKEIKRNVVVLILWTVFLLGVLLAPISEMGIFIPWGFKHFDKVAHFCLFAVTGFVAVFGANFGSQFKSRMCFGIAFGLLLALGTEFAQSLVPFRDTSLYDLLADVVGLGVGLVLYTLLYIRYRQRV